MPAPISSGHHKNQGKNGSINSVFQGLDGGSNARTRPILHDNVFHVTRDQADHKTTVAITLLGLKIDNSVINCTLISDVSVPTPPISILWLPEIYVFRRSHGRGMPDELICILSLISATSALQRHFIPK